MYPNILIPTDGSELSEKAVSHGIALAEQMVTVLTVLFHPLRFLGRIMQKNNEGTHAFQDTGSGSSMISREGDRGGQVRWTLISNHGERWGREVAWAASAGHKAAVHWIAVLRENNYKLRRIESVPRTASAPADGVAATEELALTRRSRPGRYVLARLVQFRW
jgi:nucleotide-binding universal stress UspA family protein